MSGQESAAPSHEKVRATLQGLSARFLLNGAELPEFTAISYDSRSTPSGAAFFCLPGERTNGNEFARDAIARGASVVVSEQENADIAVPQVIVPDVRLALALVSDAYWGNPSRHLRLLGVTGTNGKTTTTHLVEHVLAANGIKCGLIGTLGSRWPGHVMDEAKHTTPQAPELHRLFATMLDGGCTHASMEVSSHSLSLKRVSGCEFAVACLTNLTQDHLDFHKTMEHYWRSKRQLFEMLSASSHSNKSAIINGDDALAGEFKKACDNNVRVITYGIDSAADVRAESFKVEGGFNHIQATSPWGNLDLRLRLVGRFNIYNALAAAAICLSEGITPAQLEACLSDFSGVAGRFEVVTAGGEQEPLCIVDYAHTPDGLENVLKTAADLRKPGAKLIVVFGCGGDRDPSKRPRMGEIAEACADSVIVTSDNPRTENPQEIIANILTGIRRMRHVEVEPDRAKAIRMAVSMAGNNDVVVVAGKGHENYQIVGNQVLPFDDKVEVSRALSQLQGQ